jgi:hypothetical protein
MIFITPAHRGTSFAVIFDDVFTLHGSFESAEKEANELSEEHEVSIFDLTVSTRLIWNTSLTQHRKDEEQRTTVREAVAEEERRHNLSLAHPGA